MVCLFVQDYWLPVDLPLVDMLLLWTCLNPLLFRRLTFLDVFCMLHDVACMVSECLFTSWPLVKPRFKPNWYRLEDQEATVEGGSDFEDSKHRISATGKIM